MKDLTHSFVLRLSAFFLVIVAVVALALEIKVVPPVLFLFAFACLSLASGNIGQGKPFSKHPDQS